MLHFEREKKQNPHTDSKYWNEEMRNLILKVQGVKDMAYNDLIKK